MTPIERAACLRQWISELDAELAQEENRSRANTDRIRSLRQQINHRSRELEELEAEKRAEAEAQHRQDAARAAGEGGCDA